MHRIRNRIDTYKRYGRITGLRFRMESGGSFALGVVIFQGRFTRSPVGSTMRPCLLLRRKHSHPRYETTCTCIGILLFFGRESIGRADLGAEKLKLSSGDLRNRSDSSLPLSKYGN